MFVIEGKFEDENNNVQYIWEKKAEPGEASEKQAIFSSNKANSVF